MIWCVEDDVSIRDIEIYTLEQTGFTAKGFCDGDSFWVELATTDELPELVILDIMLPSMNGFEICRRIKRVKATPVIMLSAKSSVIDKVNGLKLGADDYISKPFAIEELLARIEVVFRRESNPKDSIFKFKDITIDTKSRIVKRNNEEINLTNKEYELLMILIENKDEVVTRDELLERIWGYDTETNVTDVYIRHLRSKLNNENKEEYIQTVRSIGYIMRS